MPHRDNDAGSGAAATRRLQGESRCGCRMAMSFLLAWKEGASGWSGSDKQAIDLADVLGEQHVLVAEGI
ncbi:hypothetical protein [Paracraurococcus lichenis]|uniref:Uncharacterized protein n=1 Tax=Paracraurococcus lichenis TaxID=3064888 RepID=A0ABT9EDN4_9PROT|nr:hypothetical protein [Paracraurococcus sp. LOR1-02]MDO9714316.1 hypothetical protein [Paracraurococcus sp. LOR1-02]